MAKTAARPDFGKDGRLIVRTDEQGAHVRVSTGEFIRSTLTARGPGRAIFSFSCQHRQVCSNDDFPGHPQPQYDWKHLTQPKDSDAPSDSYALTLAFAGAVTSYTFLMVKVDAGGTVLATLKDFDASSTAPDDVFHSGITLFVS